MNGVGTEWAKIRVESVCADTSIGRAINPTAVPYPILCLLCQPAFSVESSSNNGPIMALQCEAALWHGATGKGRWWGWKSRLC